MGTVGQTTCSVCVAGTYQVYTGMSVCTACAPGLYSTITGGRGTFLLKRAFADSAVTT